MKNFVVHQKQRIEQLEKELEESKQRQENLEEKVNINSNNSSIPPSTEIVKPEKKQKPKKQKEKEVDKKVMLGENFGGILGSDRYASYNWIDVNRRQLCWAHLKREFQKISERSGASRQIRRDLRRFPRKNLPIFFS